MVESWSISASTLAYPGVFLPFRCYGVASMISEKRFPFSRSLPFPLSDLLCHLLSFLFFIRSFLLIYLRRCSFFFFFFFFLHDLATLLQGGRGKSRLWEISVFVSRYASYHAISRRWYCFEQRKHTYIQSDRHLNCLILTLFNFLVCLKKKLFFLFSP